jgi:replicative DNA helicase
MGAHEELRLVTKIIDSGEILPVINAKITPDHFQNEYALGIFNRIMKDWRRWKGKRPSIPTREVIEREFPTVDLPKEDRQSLDVIVDSFVNHHLICELQDIADFITNWKDNPDDVLRQLNTRVRELAHMRRVGQDITISSSLKEVVDRYESNRDQDGIKGIPYPWDVLNHATQGMLPGEFILFYGRPKSLKTWVLLSLATHAYDYASRRVLIYTREMTPQQMMDRCICLLLGTPYTAYKEGKLAEIPLPGGGGNMEDLFYDLTSSMEIDEQTCALETGYNKSLIITSDRDDPRGGGVQGLRQKVEDHKPDLICADALYLMRNDRSGGKRSVKWDDQAAITQDLKDLALDTNKPLLGTTQAKRASEENKGKSVSNISFSDSYGMDCDLAIEIIKKKITDETNELALAITGAREINISGFAINGNPASDFGPLYEKFRDQAGVEQLDGDGNPLVVPVIFSDYKDIKDFLKQGEEHEKPKDTKTKAQYARLAKAAFKEARKHS